jgi:hypothetical protein
LIHTISHSIISNATADNANIKDEQLEEESLKARRIIDSLGGMVARIMTREVTPALVEECDDFIKIFLSCVEDLDSVMREKTKKKNATSAGSRKKNEK